MGGLYIIPPIPASWDNVSLSQLVYVLFNDVRTPFASSFPSSPVLWQRGWENTSFPSAFCTWRFIKVAQRVWAVRFVSCDTSGDITDSGVSQVLHLCKVTFQAATTTSDCAEFRCTEGNQLLQCSKDKMWQTLTRRLLLKHHVSTSIVPLCAEPWTVCTVLLAEPHRGQGVFYVLLCDESCPHPKTVSSHFKQICSPKKSNFRHCQKLPLLS